MRRARVVWVTGASAGIGQALVRSVPWPDALVIGVSRHGLGEFDPEEFPRQSFEGLAADLSERAGWDAVEESFRNHLGGGVEGAVFVHAAAAVGPIGLAGEVDSAAYTRSILLNTVSPLVLGESFVRMASDAGIPGQVVMLTSGPSVYPGWSVYKAGKVAMNAWVQAIGDVQGGGGCRVLAVAPGLVETGMQTALRAADPRSFPARDNFIDAGQTGETSTPEEVAPAIWAVLTRKDLANGAVVDLRDS